MKRVSLTLVCVLFVALMLPASALAGHDGPQPQAPHAFRIVGYTTSYDYHTLSTGWTTFRLTAEGDGETDTLSYGKSGVTGDLAGAFGFVEQGIVDFDPATGQGSGQGANSAIMTISTEDGGRVVVAFGGRSTLETVSGRFTVLRGTGRYRGLRGWGTYDGVPDACWAFPPGPDTCTGFYVDFTFTRSFYGHLR